MSRKRIDPALAAWSGVPHVRIRHDLLNSPAYRVLPAKAVKLYNDLRAKLNSSNNGNIEATLKDLKHRGWKSSSTLFAALRELEHMGFIAKTRQGGIAAMSKVCNLYRFTDLDVYEHPKQGIQPIRATLDWLRLDSVRAAEAHLRELPKPSKKSKVRNPKLLGSESEPMSPFIASDSEQVRSAKVRNPNKGNRPQTRAVAGGSCK